MLKTRKERAYLIAILVVLAAILGVILFGARCGAGRGRRHAEADGGAEAGLLPRDGA